MIFYFSATGNSRYVADKLQKAYGTEKISIGDAVRRKRFVYEPGIDEKLFFVIPVYFYGLPSVVTEFLEHLELKGGSFNGCLILTYGGKPGAADKMFLKSMEKSNCNIKAVYGVKMPDNCVTLFKIPDKETQASMLEEAEKEIDKITELALQDFSGGVKSGFPASLLTKAAYPFYDRFRKTDKFFVEDNCIGCGLCQMVCPSDVIYMEDGRPYWDKEKCCWCLGCINRCPVQAIQFGEKTKDRGRYINPVFKR